MFDAMERKELRSLLVIGENPARSEADVSRAVDLLEGLEHLVVLDIHLTSTAELADVVLPGSASWCESDGTVTNLEFPQSSVAAFDASAMGVYFGSQNNQIAYIGKSVTYSNVKVLVGDTAIVDDSFEEIDEFEVLNPDAWERTATLQAAHVITDERAVWMTWTLPDMGWIPAASSNLKNWTGLSNATPASIGGTRGLLLQGDNVPSGTSGYFRMQTN